MRGVNMDANKTGRFISELRKEKGLTQKEFASRICVSDKTISRWETGKGYPDIEILPELSKELGVNISEILDGKRSDITDVQSKIVYEKNLQGVCNSVKENNAKKKKKVKKLQAALVILSLLLSGSLLVSFFTTRMVVGYESIVGSENCIIASDYSKINYFGTTYVPIIITEASEIRANENITLIEEAQVEGYGFIAKLPFGEKIYAVDGVLDNDIIFLQTNGLIGYSRYFCKEEKYNYYYEYFDLQSYQPNECFIDVELNFFEPDFLSIKDEEAEYLTNLKNSGTGVSYNALNSNILYEFDLYTYEEGINNLGKFLVLKDAVYFSPSLIFSSDKEKLLYKIDDEHFEYFYNLFSKDYNLKKAIKNL